MKEQPEKMTVCKLECLLMPQGEIICGGKTIGWFRDFKKHLEIAAAPALLGHLKHAHTVLACLRTSATTKCECSKHLIKQMCDRCAIDTELGSIEVAIAKAEK